MREKSYPSDVTDAQWALLELLLPTPDPEGGPLEIERRDIVNAIFSVLHTGCPWRYVPCDVPKWPTVYSSFRDWKRDGTWEEIHTALRKQLRVQMGRDPEPSTTIIESQSITTSSVRGDERGSDGGKKIQGRKRHLLVDVNGLVLAVNVHAANIPDRHGAPLLLGPLVHRFPRLQLIWADSGSNGKCRGWIKEHLGVEVEIVNHPWTGIKGVWAPEGTEIDWDTVIPKGFHVLPRRWVVERTNAGCRVADASLAILRGSVNREKHSSSLP